MPEKLRLLIVEDEEAIQKGLCDVFVYHGYEVQAAGDGAKGLELALKGKFDLIILDVMLPKRDGFSVCNEIRKHDRAQPIIMLTAKTSEEDIVAGLSIGADDYIAKPFSVRELVLRVEAVLRRSKKVQALEKILTIPAGIEIDTQTLLGKQRNTKELLQFSRTEVELLRFLKQNSDRPVSRGELLVEVWGYAKAAQIETRTVDIHIAKLRKKIEPDPKNPRYLVTVRQEGYRLVE